MSAQKCMQEARSSDFQDRIKYYLQKYALVVKEEPEATVNHSDRIVYAQKVLDGQANIYEVAIAVTTNATVSAKIAEGVQNTDGDLEYCVNTMFNAFAG